MVGVLEHIMRTPSTRRVIGVAAGLCVSFCATFSLLSFIRYTPGVMNRVGLLCAFACSIGLLVFFWAAGSAHVIHRMGWSYRSCRYVGFAFLLPGSALFLSHGRALTIANFLTVQIVLSGYICRRIAFPEISDEQAAGPEPLPTMFPK
jgi:phage shock protein PspC (stress-responsive transcriptional regulator)